MITKSFTKGKPSFCIITPTAYLEQFASQSHTHLVLAHLVDSNEQYAEFYRKMSARGDRLIMDNSAFELLGSYSPEKLIELGKKCGADALVLPDYPFQPASVTIEAAKQWIPMFKGAGFSTAFVPQSETGQLEDWIDAYRWGANNEDIDILCYSILGIPNALPHIPAAYARVVMTQLLIDRGEFDSTKFGHYLGLNAGPALEIPALIKMGALDSCDSSNPVWCGVNGIRYDITTDSYMPKSKRYLRGVDFETQRSKKDYIHECIQHNVNTTLKLFE
jgi:hypothetical protein